MSTTVAEIYTPRYRELMKEFPLRELRTKKDAQTATKILDRLFRDDFDDSGEEAYVYMLSRAMIDYEERHDPTPRLATGLELLQSLVEEHEMNQQRLGELLGVGQSAASLILSGQRPITAEHARRLGKRFRLEAGMFL